MRKRIVALSVAVATAVLTFAASGDIQREMLRAYLKTELVTRVVAEAAKMGAVADDAAKAEISSASGRYRAAVLGEVKREVTAAAGAERAQAAFVSFVDAYAKAEKEGDAAALESLSSAVGLDPAPGSFAALRSAATRTLLKDEIGKAGEFLGNVQTWLRLKAKGSVPPLHAWLNRDAKIPAPAAPRQVDAKPRKRRKSLRDSEADAGKFVEAKDDSKSSLRSFGAMRKARREKAIKDASAGMAQVSAERKSADDEASAKKLAAAQAEAQALQAQAQRLAAAEQEAVIQDQNSWRTRAKDVLASAAGAAGSAFLGNVGGRVGEATARAVFK